MADDRSIRVRLIAEFQSYKQGLQTAARETANFGKELTGLQQTAGANLEKIGRGALIMSGAMTAGLALSVKAAVDWESAWAGVTKTVEGTAAQMTALEDGLRSMAGELPASHAEIAGVAEAAGQLGVKVGDVEAFTRVMIDLGETTNLTADEAATSLARIANIMGTSGRDVERMGSTIVELGNNSATTEAEIVELATRLAAAGKIAGLSEADVFAFASTLTSVGVEAEAGGTALSKVFTSVRDAVLDGGESLETFAEVAGVSTAKFSSAFRQDASGAIALFIKGLGDMNEQGRSTTGVFEDLELTDQRLMRALLSTASAGSLLTDQLGMAADAWEENTALQTEAEKRYETTAAQIEILRNKVTDLGIDAGSVLLPALNGVVGALGNMADGMAALPDPVGKLAVALATVSTAGVGIIGVMATMAPKIAAAKKALADMGTGAQFVGRNMGKLAGAAGLVGAAVGAGILIYEQATRASREYDEAVKKMTGSLQAVREGQQSVNEALDEFLAAQQLDLSTGQIDVMNELGVAVQDVRDAITSGKDSLDPFREAIRGLGIDISDVDVGEMGALDDPMLQLTTATGLTSEAVIGLIDIIEDYDNVQQDAAENTVKAMLNSKEITRAQFDQAIATNKLKDGTINYVGALDVLRPKQADSEEALERQQVEAEQTEEALAALSERLTELGDAFGEFTDATTAHDDVYDRAEAAAREHAEALAEAHNDSLDERVQAVRDAGADTAEALTQEAQDHIDAAGLTGQAARDVQRAASDKADAVRESADNEAEALAEGSTSWEDYVEDVKVSVGDYIAEMESQIAAQEEWRTNISDIAFRGRADVAEILAGMGPEGAEQARLFGEMTDAEFEIAADLFVQTMTDGGEAVGLTLEAQMGIAAALGKTGAKDTVEAIAEEFNVGLDTVIAIAAAYGIELGTTLHPMFYLLDALDAKARAVGQSVLNNASIIARDQMLQSAAPPVKPGLQYESDGGQIAPRNYLAGGGSPWQPRGSDTVPVMATPGEFMMQKSAVDRWGLGLMHALNDGVDARRLVGAVGGSSSVTHANDNSRSSAIHMHYHGVSEPVEMGVTRGARKAAAVMG